MSRAQTTVIALLAAALCVVGLWVGSSQAGPLDPPASPIAQTDPDLGQILSEVHTLGGECATAPTTPGVACTAQLTIPGLGTYDRFEFEFGSTVQDPNAMPAARVAEMKQVRAVRTADGNSPFLFQSHVMNTLHTNVYIQQGRMLNTFSNARLDGISNQMVHTCEGPVCAEEIVLTAKGLTYTVGGNSIGWDYSTNTAIP